MSAPTGPVDEDAPDREFGDSGIEVEVHAHFGMTGSFPLQIAELFFATDGVHLVEYGLITPLFGIGSRKHKREAGAMQEIYRRFGIDEVIARADAVTWLDYDAIDRVVVTDGGRFGNPRIGVYPQDGEGHAYRMHDEEFDPDAFAAELSTLADRRGFDVIAESGLGYRPGESLRRFFS